MKRRPTWVEALAFIAVAAAAALFVVWIAERGKHETVHDVLPLHVDHVMPRSVLRTENLGPAPAFQCVPTSEPHVEALLLNPPSAGALTVDDVRAGMLNANALLNTSATPGGATFRVRCDATGQLAVTVVPTTPDPAFYTVVTSVQTAGFSTGNTRYVLVYNQPGGGGNGIGEIGTTDSGTYYSIIYGNAVGQLLLHELTHTLSAVQGTEHAPAAPNSTYAGHCNDGLGPYGSLTDVMCYPDGGIRQAQHNAGCTTLTYDCNHDDYAAVAPSPGSWLALHPEFNVLACQDKYVRVNACLPPTTTTSTTTTTPVTTTHPTTTTTPTSTTTTTATLSAPTGFTTPIKTCASIGIAWSPVSGASRYYVQRRVNGGAWSTTYVVTTPRLNTGWAQAGTYDFRVRAVGATTSDYGYLNGVKRPC